MGKRTAPDADARAGQEARHQKRQRVENSLERGSPRPAAPSVEDVNSARQLEKALVFDKGAVPAFRNSKLI